MSSKYLFLIAVAFVAGGACTWMLLHFPSSLQTSDHPSLDYNTPAPLANIPAPNGWSAQRISASDIQLTKDGAGASRRISITALKMFGSLQDEIKIYESGYPLDESMTYRPYVGAVADGWATINGNLILRSISREADAGTGINYKIFHGDTLYLLSMYYQTYDGKAFKVMYPEDVATLQELVTSFAQSL